ncbi:MAG: FAD-dependent oxidoreductase, partial [Myxococcales bacterium]|nr:FAD-dependent oxidoreductase [Myxococcales bacterium]
MKVAVLGAGPAGLTAAKVLIDGDVPTTVLEREAQVGGLACTRVHGEFRYDLGGHRFFTKNEEVFALFKEVLGDELIGVHRSSKIFFKNRYFDYPLEPANAFFGLGPKTAFEILVTYLYEKFKFGRPVATNLEEWVTREFGSKMFQLYFKEYTEKVWGIDCREIAAEWVAQRIKGMSLRVAIRNAFLKKPDEDPLSLLTYFYYPRLGIGRLSERMEDMVNAHPGSQVLKEAPVIRIHHENDRVLSVTHRTPDGQESDVVADHFINSMPVTDAVRMLRPRPPKEILDAANALDFRCLVSVHLEYDAPQVTKDNWVYIPERHIKFGRIHEPKNWSPAMAPADKTGLVFEYFCFPDDEVWKMADEDLISLTARDFASLNL